MPSTDSQRPAPVPPLGAHMSIAGGVHRAVDRAVSAGCRSLQIFTKSNSQWRARRLPDDEVRRFRRGVREAGLRHVVAHNSYLINMASPDQALRRRSIRAMVRELERCELLGIRDLIAHPGAHMGAGPAAGAARVARSLDRIHRETAGIRARVVLETTAGQGTSLGRSFEELGRILDAVSRPERVAVCFDTCHVFAAGYELRTRDGWDSTWEEFDRHIGPGRLAAFHVNDSRKDRGCRVDRHEAIGRGFMGLAPFRFLMNDDELCSRPLILETPKSSDGSEDRRNLATLRSLREGDTRRREAS